MDPVVVELLKFTGIGGVFLYGLFRVLTWVGENVVKPVVDAIKDHLTAATANVREQTSKLQSVDAKVDIVAEKIDGVLTNQREHMDMCRPKYTGGHPSDLPPRDENFGRRAASSV